MENIVNAQYTTHCKRRTALRGLSRSDQIMSKNSHLFTMSVLGLQIIQIMLPHDTPEVQLAISTLSLKGGMTP